MIIKMFGKWLLDLAIHGLEPKEDIARPTAAEKGSSDVESCQVCILAKRSLRRWHVPKGIVSGNVEASERGNGDVRGVAWRGVAWRGMAWAKIPVDATKTCLHKEPARRTAHRVDLI